MKQKLILVIAFLLIGVTTINAQETTQDSKGIKYQGDYSVGGGIAAIENSFGNLYLQTVQGLRFTDHFSAGIGVGLTIFDISDPLYLIPITINSKGYIPITAKNELFISLDLGISCAADIEMQPVSFVLYPAIGFTFCEKFSASIGYDCVFPYFSVAAFKLGYTY